MPAIQNTFHIELVSPILTKLNDLKDLLEFLGMQNPSCFVANDSAGFHVNVSLRNKKTGKPIPLIRDFFIRTFFPRYKIWESIVYPKVRTEISTEYARCIGSTNAEKYSELYHEICEDKYVSLHRKEPTELVEFRLFGSTNNMSDLLKYTKMATDFLRNSYMIWYEYYRPTMKRTNSNIMKRELQLQRNLLNVQSRIRTRKTKNLVSKRETIQKNLQTLKTLRGKNARTRRAILNNLSARRNNKTVSSEIMSGIRL
jgi:hypothetical protein